MKPKLWFTLFIAGVLTLCAGCASLAPAPNPELTTESPLPAARQTLRPGVQTAAAPTPAASPTPSPSPVPSSTATHRPTSTPTASLTWTPASTLSWPEAHALARDLLDHNGGCRLPCWWGLTPGQTDWNAARHFLETFAVEIGQGEEGYVELDGVSVYATNYGIGYEREDGGSGFTMGIIDGIIEGIETGWDNSQHFFELDRLLADYGRPEEVFVSAHRVTSTGDPPPFSILVWYKEQGFWADYGFDGELVGEQVRGCPRDTNPGLYLNSPNEKWTREEMFRETFGRPIAGAPEYPTLTLEEATGMDGETFYQAFKEPGNQHCLETPAGLWPP